ncbi:MAG: S8 family serine peptidase [Burkholderiales bacterium]|nr:S8 family serine peptidase [Burkholderiales bacterium]
MSPRILRKSWLSSWLRLIGLVLLGCLWVTAARAEAAWANGVIVKLKDEGGVQTPHRDQASRLTFASATRADMRLTGMALRHHLPYLEHRPTAFAAHVLRAGQPIPLAQAQAQAERLRRDPEVEWAIPNVIEKPAGAVAGSDPWFAWQTWLQPRDAGRLGVAGFPAAWHALETQALSQVVVAVLDSGVLPSPDLVGRFWPGYDFVSEVEYDRDGDGRDSNPQDPGDWLTAGEKAANPQLYGDCSVHDSNWHGLAVSSMLAANTDNNIDGGGILAPLSGPVVLPVRVAGICGAAVSDIVEGMLWAAGLAFQGSPTPNSHPARIINLSFGGSGSCDDTGVHDAAWLYRQTLSTLRSHGVLVVASAGNGEVPVGNAQPTRPASCPGVLAVTALHEQGFKASYANLVDSAHYAGLAVAGGDFDDHAIVTLSNSGTTRPDLNGDIPAGMAGTSFAAPTVAGVAALMLAVDPYLSVDELVTGLTSTALPHLSRTDGASLSMRDLPTCAAGVAMAQCYCDTASCGAGRLDALGAVHYALDQLGAHPNGTTAGWSGSSPSSSGSGGGGGGGGGAMDPSSLAVLAMLMWLTLIGGGKR